MSPPFARLCATALFAVSMLRQLGRSFDWTVRNVGQRALPAVVGALLLAFVVAAVGLFGSTSPPALIALDALTVCGLLVLLGTQPRSLIRGAMVFITVAGCLGLTAMALSAYRPDLQRAEASDEPHRQCGSGRPDSGLRRPGLELAVPGTTCVLGSRAPDHSHRWP